MEVFQVTNTKEAYSFNQVKKQSDDCSLFNGASLASMENMFEALGQGMSAGLGFIDRKNGFGNMGDFYKRFALIQGNSNTYVVRNNDGDYTVKTFQKDDEENTESPTLRADGGLESNNIFCYGVKPCEHKNVHDNLVVKPANGKKSNYKWSVRKNPDCHTGLTTIELVLVIIAALLIVGLLGSLAYKRFSK